MGGWESGLLGSLQAVVGGARRGLESGPLGSALGLWGMWGSTAGGCAWEECWRGYRDVSPAVSPQGWRQVSKGWRSPRPCWEDSCLHRAAPGTAARMPCSLPAVALLLLALTRSLPAATLSFPGDLVPLSTVGLTST